MSSSGASELIKSFDTTIGISQLYDWFGLSLWYKVYPQSGLNVSIELMFEFILHVQTLASVWCCGTSLTTNWASS